MSKKDYITFANALKDLFSEQYADEYGKISFEREQKEAILLMFKRVFSDDNELFNNKRFIDAVNE